MRVSPTAEKAGWAALPRGAASLTKTISFVLVSVERFSVHGLSAPPEAFPPHQQKPLVESWVQATYKSKTVALPLF